MRNRIFCASVAKRFVSDNVSCLFVCVLLLLYVIFIFLIVCFILFGIHFDAVFLPIFVQTKILQSDLSFSKHGSVTFIASPRNRRSTSVSLQSNILFLRIDWLTPVSFLLSLPVISLFTFTSATDWPSAHI